MQRRLLTSMFGVAIAAVLVFGAGLEVVAVSHRSGSQPIRLSPVQVGVLGLIALVVAAGLTMAQARRLARPLQDLARAADRIGSGDARPVGRRYGIGELDRVAEGLDNAAERVTDLISAGPAGRRPARRSFPASTTSSASRWSSGSRRSARRTGSWRCRATRACGPMSAPAGS